MSTSATNPPAPESTWTPGQVAAAARLFPNLPSKAVSAFPAGWRRLPAGRFVYAVMDRLGFANWGVVSAGDRNQFRALFSLFEAGLVPDDAPPPVAPPVVQTQPSSFHPSCAEERDDVSLIPALLDSPVLVRAEMGDALHKWDIRLVGIAMGLTGPDKARWLNYYGSNAHQAAYLCDVEGLPYPDAAKTIKHYGDRFESEYLDVDFRSGYLSATLGIDYYQMVKLSLKELLW